MLLSVPPRTGFNPYNGYNSRNSKKVTQSDFYAYLTVAFPKPERNASYSVLDKSTSAFCGIIVSSCG